MGKKKKNELIEIIRAAVEATHEPLDRVIALDDDSEAVHQYRVKIRQLRSLISFFKPKMHKKKVVEMNQRLKDMAGNFSAVRELDVLTMRWSDIENDQNAEEHDFGVGLMRAKQQARIEAYANFNATKAKSDLVWINKQLDSLFCDDEQLSSFIEKRLNDWLVSIRKGIKKLDIEDYSAMHQLRIRMKRLRYALTLLSGHADEAMEEKIKPSKLWAEQLGIICDFERNKEILNELFVRDVQPKFTFLKSMKKEVDEIHEQLMNTKI